MSIIVSIFFITFLIIVFKFIFYKKSEGYEYEIDLYKSKSLMTANEKEFFYRLKDALPNHHIFTQVSLGALLQPNVKSDNRKYYSVRGTFAQKIADYVITDYNLTVVAIIELDDRTHLTEKDARRDAMLEQAGYNVIRWHSRKKPSIQDITEAIAANTM